LPWLCFVRWDRARVPVSSISRHANVGFRAVPARQFVEGDPRPLCAHRDRAQYRRSSLTPSNVCTNASPSAPTIRSLERKHGSRGGTRKFLCAIRFTRRRRFPFPLFDQPRSRLAALCPRYMRKAFPAAQVARSIKQRYRRLKQARVIRIVSCPFRDTSVLKHPFTKRRPKRST